MSGLVARLPGHTRGRSPRGPEAHNIPSRGNTGAGASGTANPVDDPHARTHTLCLQQQPQQHSHDSPQASLTVSALALTRGPDAAGVAVYEGKCLDGVACLLRSNTQQQQARQAPGDLSPLSALRT